MIELNYYFGEDPLTIGTFIEALQELPLNMSVNFFSGSVREWLYYQPNEEKCLIFASEQASPDKNEIKMVINFLELQALIKFLQLFPQNTLLYLSGEARCCIHVDEDNNRCCIDIDDWDYSYSQIFSTQYSSWKEGLYSDYDED